MYFMEVENMIVKAKFELGQTVATRGIMDLLDEIEISELMDRHVTGDWGDLCEEDKEQNELALIFRDSRLFSSYVTPKGKVWIITEHDRSVTTVLLPEEY